MKLALALASAAIVMTGCGNTRYHNAVSNYNATIIEARSLAESAILDMAEAGIKFSQENDDGIFIEAAEDAVRRVLKDPDSAKFQEMVVRDHRGGKVVCGNVNSKNSYGGYVGFTPFVAGPTTAMLLDTDSRKNMAGFVAAVNYALYTACPKKP